MSAVTRTRSAAPVVAAAKAAEKPAVSTEAVRQVFAAKLNSKLQELSATGTEAAQPEFWWDLMAIGPIQFAPPALSPAAVVDIGDTAYVITVLVLNPALMLPGPTSPKAVLETFNLTVDLTYSTGNKTTWTLAEPACQLTGAIPLSPGGGIFGSEFYVDVQAFSPTTAGLHEMNITANIPGMGGIPSFFGGYSAWTLDLDFDWLAYYLGFSTENPDRRPVLFQVQP
ncbi:MAG: hypothetical protein U0822_22345 [Anaerolineae bacterium]